MSGNEISSQDIKIFFNASLATVRSCDATPLRCEFFRVCQADTRHPGLQTSPGRRGMTTLSLVKLELCADINRRSSSPVLLYFKPSQQPAKKTTLGILSVITPPFSSLQDPLYQDPSITSFHLVADSIGALVALVAKEF